MSATSLKKLYTIAPGFRHDKDDDWVNYLPLGRQTFVRGCRETFVVMKDKLDGVKLQLKDHKNHKSSEYIAISRNLADLEKKLEELIKNRLLVELAPLKERAEKAQERLIEKDFAPADSSASSATPVFGGMFASMASEFDDFLPSHLITPTAQPTPCPEAPAAVEKPAGPATRDVTRQEPARDTYLDDVDGENVEIMKGMRPVVEKYDCRDRVLAALRAIRHRDRWLDILEEIKKDFPVHEARN